MDIAATRLWDAPSVSCCQSGFEPLTPGTSANLPHRVQRRGSWVSDRKSLRLHKDGHEFPAEAAICQLELGQQRVFTVLIRDITDRKRREMHAQILMRELEHRVHNVLARVQMVIERGAEGQHSLDEFRLSLLARIQSMMHAHELLRQTNWFGATVTDLIADQLKPYATSHNNRMEGPEIMLNPDATQALSMVIHELTTNAVKHGALSVPNGHITVSWEQPERGSRERFCSVGLSRAGPK